VFTLRHCQNESNWTGIWTERFIHTYVLREEEIPWRRKLRYMCGRLGRLSEMWIWTLSGKQDWEGRQGEYDGGLSESRWGNASCQRTIAWSVMGFSSAKSLKNMIRDSSNCLWKIKATSSKQSGIGQSYRTNIRDRCGERVFLSVIDIQNIDWAYLSTHA
jgi:hypothetical protein